MTACIVRNSSHAPPVSPCILVAWPSVRPVRMVEHFVRRCDATRRYRCSRHAHAAAAMIAHASAHRRREPSHRDKQHLLTHHRLFVAPVESDVSRKSTQKNGTTSPPRTSIRRVNRSTDRERRNMSRAAARMFGPVQRTLSSIVQDRTPEESLRYITREATRGNERAEESMATVFGSSWYDLPHGPPSDEQNQDPGLIWWSEELNRGQRPRTVSILEPDMHRLLTHLLS